MQRFPLTLLVAFAASASLYFANAAEPAKSGSSSEGITDVKQTLTGITRDTLQDLRPGSRKMEEAAAKATEVVRKNVEGKTATLKMTVDVVEKFQRKDAPDVTRTRLRASNDSVRESGATLKVYLMVVPDVSENDKLAKIAKGSKITITGKISNGEILARKSAELHIDVMDAKLQ